jgi:hypothetical protein
MFGDVEVKRSWCTPTNSYDRHDRVILNSYAKALTF